jgi:hypothetical protein
MGYIIHMVNFSGYGIPTLCFEVEAIMELVAMVPGSEISAKIRREAVELFVRVKGEDSSLVDEIITNRRLQEYLKEKDPEHPFLAFRDFVEQRHSRPASESEDATSPPVTTSYDIEVVLNFQFGWMPGYLKSYRLRVIAMLTTSIPHS